MEKMNKDDNRTLSQELRCPICSSEANFWSSVDNYKLYKCVRCGHGFFNPGVSSKEELKTFYNQDYAEDYNPDINNESFIQRQRQYQLDIQYLYPYLSKDDVKVLDFGCSTGQFLNIMPDSWQKNGFEVNQFEMSYIRDNYKDINVFSEIKQLEESSFDLITLRGVIEHLFDFDDLFRAINKSIRSGGLVYICATPDFNSPCSVLYLSEWNQISAPLHYHQFTASSLALLFAKAGFGLKGLHYDYIDSDYAVFQSDAAKFIKNTQALSEKGHVSHANHAYPGTMVNMIFEKIECSD